MIIVYKTASTAPQASFEVLVLLNYDVFFVCVSMP